MNKPRFFYGWVNVAVFFVIALAAWGPQYSFGVFFKPLAEEFGWTRAQVSGAMTTNLIIGGILAFVIGGLADRYGPRRIMYGVAILIGGGYLALSRLTTLWHLYLWFGLVVGVGMSAAYIVPAATVSRWFVARRGLALGIMMAGMGFSQILIPPAVAVAISRLGWRNSYTMIGVGVLVLLLPLANFLRKSPEDYGLRPDGVQDAAVPNTRENTRTPEGFSLKQAIRLPAFWLLFAIWIFLALPGFLTLVHVVPLVTDVNPDIDARAAATVISFIGVAGISGRLFFGYASDRWGGRTTATLCLGMMAIAMVEMMFAQRLTSFFIAAVVFGAGYNGADTATIKMAGDFFGRRSIGAVMGLTGLGFRIGASSGALVGGVIYDVTGKYQASFAIAALCALIGILLTLAIFRYKPVTS